MLERWKGLGSITPRAGRGRGVSAHPIKEAWHCFAAPTEDRELSLWGLPWVPQGCLHSWECWIILAAPSEGPFPSCAALPTKRPPAPTRSTATESASGLAAKPSVRTWGSLSSKCHIFGGSFPVSGWDSMELVEGSILRVGRHPKMCTQSWVTTQRRKHSSGCCCWKSIQGQAGLEQKVTLPTAKVEWDELYEHSQGKPWDE